MSPHPLSWDVPGAFGVGVVLQMYQLALGTLTFRVSIYFEKLRLSAMVSSLMRSESSTNLWV